MERKIRAKDIMLITLTWSDNDTNAIKRWVIPVIKMAIATNDDRASLTLIIIEKADKIPEKPTKIKYMLCEGKP